MSVDKLPSGRFRVRVKRGRLVVSTKTFDRKKDALAWEAAERVHLAGGFDPRLGKSTTVAVAVTEFLAEREGRVAGSTVATDRRFLNALPVSIGRSPVGELTHAEIERYVHRLRVSAGTKKRAITSLSAFFGWAVQRGYRMDNPAQGIRVAGEASVHSATMATWDDVEQMAAAIKDPGYRLYIRVMAYTGLRPGEMRALRVGDVSGGRLRVLRSHPEGHREKDVKNHQARFVPVAVAVRADLEQHIAHRSPRERVFTAPGGGLIASRNLRRDVHWARIAPDLRLYDLRHVAVSEWVRAGVPLATVRTWARHSSLDLTSRYTHVAGSEDAAALELVNGRAGVTRGSHEVGGSLEEAN
ncbi:tyrosine-type recombinase/integrase [Brachybacterium sp. GCM10030267]|uniref:tyrosine-type recombinase/integrase n=1 Tax=Brachybacterium sp. GCM10030267 TaxID=3273381 RepID=UPI00360801BB